MGWQLMLLTTVVVAILGHTDGSTCGASTDGKCQNDSAALLQVAFGPESFPFAHKVGPEETRAKTPNDDSGGPFGPAGPKHQKAELTSMNDWHSSRDLARVWGVQNVKISPRFKVQIFSAVPVFGKDETYIVLLVEHNGDAWTDVPYRKLWTRHFNNFVMFCAGPDGSHKTQVIARGLSWVCPWPREEWENKQFEVLLEDKDGTNLGMVRAEQDPKLLGHYKTMACVRDVFPANRRGFSGPFKQWVEWMEWSSMHGLEHFLLYTFEGTDLAAVDLMTPYLDAGIASRVHFQFYYPSEMARQGHVMNDCLYRAKNHAKWLLTSVDVDEYLVFPGKVKYFNWDDILKEQGVLENKVASLAVRRVRFARARSESFDISSDHRVSTIDSFYVKQSINVDAIYRAGVHHASVSKNGAKMINVDPKLAVVNHYRLPNNQKNYAQFDFNDAEANVTDATLLADIPLLEEALTKRFNVKDMKSFLKELAQRSPPEQGSH